MCRFTSSETDLWSLQTAVGQAVVLVVNLKLLLESRHWNLPLVLSIVFSVLSFTVFTIFMQVTYLLASNKGSSPYAKQTSIHIPRR